MLVSLGSCCFFYAGKKHQNWWWLRNVEASLDDFSTSDVLVCKLLRKTWKKGGRKDKHGSHHLILFWAFYTIRPCCHPGGYYVLCCPAWVTEHVLFWYRGIKSVVIVSGSSGAQKAECSLVTRNDPRVLRLTEDAWQVLHCACHPASLPVGSCFWYWERCHHRPHGPGASLPCISLIIFRIGWSRISCKRRKRIWHIQEAVFHWAYAPWVTVTPHPPPSNPWLSTQIAVCCYLN